MSEKCLSNSADSILKMQLQALQNVFNGMMLKSHKNVIPSLEAVGFLQLHPACATL